MTKRSLRTFLAVLPLCLLPLFLSAQESKAGVLSSQDIKRVVPSVYFFRGQSAPVQLRNSGGFSTADGKLVFAGLVDTTGYSTDVQSKYQGLFITEVKLDIEGTDLARGNTVSDSPRTVSSWCWTSEQMTCLRFQAMWTTSWRGRCRSK